MRIYEIGEVVMLFLVFVLAGLLVYAITSSVRHADRRESLIEDCVADGYRRYVCEGIVE